MNMDAPKHQNKTGYIRTMNSKRHAIQETRIPRNMNSKKHELQEACNTKSRKQVTDTELQETQFARNNNSKNINSKKHVFHET